MAVSTSNPYTGDPTIPRKVTAQGVELDPQQGQAQPASTASTITQLPDGAGGAVTVPPPSMSPLTPPSGPNINLIPNAPPTAAPTVAGPPSVTSSAPASVPGTSQFGADQNLISTQINPAASPRLLGAQAQTDSAINAALSGPDRVQLGQQYYDTFAQRAGANFNRALTDATNKAAAHGQIGSGMLTNAYGDLAERFNLDNTTAASDYATKALEGTIGDRLNNASLARANEASIYGQGANDRAELRGERGYQQGLAEQAIAQRIAQNQAEQAAQAQNFGQAATVYGLGNAYDPTAAYENAAGLSSQEAAAASGDVGALIRAYLSRPQYGGGY